MWLFEKSLTDLEKMVHGYSAALFAHGIQEFGTDFNRRFCEYIWRRFGWRTTIGWARVITSHSRSPDEAFDRFFEILDEFHATGGSVGNPIA